MSAETLRKAITRPIWDTSSMAFTALWVNCLTSEETISSARIQASASPTVRRAERILSPISMPPPLEVTTTHPPHGTRRGRRAAAYCQERSAGRPFPWVTERAGGWAHLPMPRPLPKGLDLNRGQKAAAPPFFRAAQQPPRSQETPHFPRTRSAFWQRPADLSRPASRAPGSTWVGPKAPTEMTLVAPSRMMWQNAKKGGGGGGKSRRLGKVMRHKK